MKIHTVKLFDSPCPVCKGVTFYERNRRCVKCVKAEAVKKTKQHLESMGVLADRMVRNNNPAEARAMKGVWYQ